MSFTFSPLKIGGGGYNTAIRISGDGNTRLIRADTWASYTWNSATSYWDSNLNTLGGRWPTADLGVDGFGSGSYEVAIAPSNSSICYDYTFQVHKSTDGGKTWGRCAATPGGGSGFNNDPNAQNGTRFVGPKMAVHPTDPNTVYVMTRSDGLYYTQDGGTTWTHETTVPNPGTDTSGNGRAGTVTFNATGSVIFVTSFGNGLYKGTVAGAFSSVSGGPGTLAGFMSVKLHVNGALFLSLNPFPTAGALWRYVDGSPGTWTLMATPSNGQTVVCDPVLANDRVLFGDGGAGFMFSTNASATTPVWSSPVAKTRNSPAGEPPWLSTTQEGFMAEGNAEIDPVVANRLWLAEGIGTWYADLGTAGTPSSIIFNSSNKGIEGMVATQLRATPTGNLICAQWDRAIFKLNASAPDTYPTTQIIDLGASINAGWFVDWASSDGNFLVALLTGPSFPTTYGACFSSDGGSTWTNVANVPSPNMVGDVIGGSIVASTTTNWLWAAQWDHDLWFTKNGGTSWTKVDLSVSFGVPLDNSTGTGSHGTNETGWGRPSAGGGVRHHAVCADRATTGIFYAVNTGGEFDSSYAGVYKTVDGGTTWTKPRSTALINWAHDFWNIHIEAVPKLTSVDTTGHVFYTSGQSGSPGNPDTSAPFMFSLDGAATWNNVPNVFEVYAFGFGAAAAGKDYPTVFIAGWVGASHVYGIWKAEANVADWVANSVTWQFMTDYPYGWPDEVRTIDGDKLIAGRVYMGFAGSSYAYGGTTASGSIVGFSVIHGHARRHTKMIGY